MTSTQAAFLAAPIDCAALWALGRMLADYWTHTQQAAPRLRTVNPITRI